jgi:hypothetical protein
MRKRGQLLGRDLRMSPHDEPPDTKSFNTGGVAKSTSGPPQPPKPLSSETIKKILEVVEEHSRESNKEVA